ncbi:MAG: glycosyltransferase family 2 protein [Sphingomicrobium sp.]
MNLSSFKNWGGGRRPYFTVPIKFWISACIAFLWVMLSIWLSTEWMKELGATTTPLFALIAITFIAYVPGFMNAFLVTTLLLDRRPRRRPLGVYPGVSILIAAYNESAAIAETIESAANEDYQGPLEILVLNDGSTDDTVACAHAARNRLNLPANRTVRILDFPRNRGKAAALNSGLNEALHDRIVTIDGDTLLNPDALSYLIERYETDPVGTVAVAGAVLVRNAGDTLLTGAQEWDYYHGIAAVKRMQSMYHGTLVAQGAFSVYSKQALIEVGGWPECVGEDIVLTWALLQKGYRIGYAEDAIVFTNAPRTFKQFALQRKRWARGMIEALHHHESLLFKKRLSVMFIWWNLLFLPLDLVYTFLFIPGVLAAIFFGKFWVAGPMTLALLPLAALGNLVIHRTQRRTSKANGLKLKHRRGGLVFYLIAYSVLMQPICVWGYWSELLGLSKKWGKT